MRFCCTWGRDARTYGCARRRPKSRYTSGASANMPTCCTVAVLLILLILLCCLPQWLVCLVALAALAALGLVLLSPK